MARSLYIHIPFCERKCNYCAFESHVPSRGERDLYLELLEEELRVLLKGTRPQLSTCYFGGGTPTVLSPLQWGKMINIIEKYFDFESDAEVTVEANPNSLCAEHIFAWRDWRVSRVSIGVQSFDDAELQLMGRLHSAQEAHNAVSAALQYFEVNCDFIFALPFQTLENWARTLKDACISGINHISLYQLTIEENTPWEHIDTSTMPDGYEHYRFAVWYLKKHGYAHYEVANFAKNGCVSRHNINYWRNDEYYGIGPGAASYISGVRSKNYGNFAEYKSRIEAGLLPVEESEELAPNASAREAAVLALRMTSGIDVRNFAARYGAENLRKITDILRKFPQELYCATDKNIALSERGMCVANRIWSEII